MIIPETEFTLKDGRKAVLRSPREEDIPGLLEYLYISAGETEFVLRYPEECGKYTPEGEKALFDRLIIMPQLGLVQPGVHIQSGILIICNLDQFFFHSSASSCLTRKSPSIPAPAAPVVSS